MSDASDSQRLDAAPGRLLLARLELATSPADIARSLQKFVCDAGDHLERARALSGQTTYWVYSSDEDCFGPGKFVGYLAMDFQRYEQAVEGRTEGAKFDGHASRMAIERAVGAGFIDHEQLGERLASWTRGVLGADVFDGVDRSKWRFVMLPSSRNYWALLANPEVYRIEQAVSELQEDLWTDPRQNMRAGDQAIIWKAAGSSGRRGVIAMADVLTDPAPLVSPPHLAAYWVQQPAAEPRTRVRLRYVRSSRAPLWLDQDDSGLLRSLSVARASGGGVFRIEPHQWHALVDLLGSVGSPVNETVDNWTPPPAEASA